MKTADFLSLLKGVKRTHDGQYQALCPGHADKTPSLSIKEADGKILLKCFAGCELAGILKPLNLEPKDLFLDGQKAKPAQREIEAVYPYIDAKGKPFEAVRFRPKSFKQRRPDGKGGYIWDLKGITPTLYHEDEIRPASAQGKPVYVVEGEKDVDRVRSLGLVATTNPMGAGKWQDSYSEALRGADLIIIPDNDLLKPEPDTTGWEHAQSVARSCYGKAKSVKLLQPFPDAKDVSDWLDKGHSVDELQQLADTCSDYEPSQPVGAAPASPSWPPPLEAEAFYGLAGEVVRAIEPHTEGDPTAILLNFLTFFGNAVGRGPHAVAEADHHGCNLSCVHVGETSKARKGSALGHARELSSKVDPTWTLEHITGGLSSGEGLVWAVRDRIEKVVKGEPTVVDAGVEDKRLLVIETEFAGTLKVMAREGNTLSATIRQAWDSGILRILTKNSPAVATGAHISIIGHVTKDELLRYLNDIEAGNGFANRFLWACVRRSKVLPEGGGAPDLSAVIPRLHTALEIGQKMGEIKRDTAARRLWADVYPELSEGKPGLLGAVTARAEAQVLRLSVIYAVLDGDTEIRTPHLAAALAVWDYCEASARFIFGDALGDPVADRIVEGLRASPQGLSRTDISQLFARHVSLARLDQALGLLLRSGRAHPETRATEGRPVEVWVFSHNPLISQEG